MIKLKDLIELSEQGRRSNNEDAIRSFLNEGKDGGVFVVCDGVGGEEKGEVASGVVSEVFLECLKNKPLDELDAQEVLGFSEKKLSDQLLERSKQFNPYYN